MSITSPSSFDRRSPAVTPPPFLWLNPLKPTKFRVMLALGLGVFVLLMNLLVPGTLGLAAYALSLIVTVSAYLLAEVLLVALVTLGPLLVFIYAAFAYFSH